MGVEVANDKVEIYGMGDDYVSDSELIAHVQDALRAVAHGDRERYDQLNEIMDPSVNLGPDHEALLFSTLKALSGAVSYIDVVHHQSLYSSILGMSIWNFGSDVRDALVELVTCLAVSSGMFLDACLDMLVCNFLPPQNLEESMSHSRWPARKEEVIARVLSTLQDIADLVPLTPLRLLPIIERRMPHKLAPKKVIVIYVECMLRLEGTAIGEFVGSSLLKAVVDRLVDLDVDIRWEDILQEDCSKGIFDMELEDVEENADGAGKIGKMPEGSEGIFKGNVIADKLDSLMVITCEHIKLCASHGRLAKVFETLIESFLKTVLTAYKSKFAQFLMFYACSLDPDNCGVKFADLLTDIFLSRTDPPLFRMSAVSYLASYLSRAKFLSSSLVAKILERLIGWCSEYCHVRDGKERAINPKAHQIFYSGCQAVMYVLCFRMKSMMDVPHLKSLLFQMPLEPILRHNLDPLKVCLPSIVQEFSRQVKAAHLFTSSMTFLFDSLLESELSKDFGGIERLDMFFPFDPYLLKESDRFIRPNFEYWSTVRTTYGIYSSEEEDLDDDFENGCKGSFDEPIFVNDVGSLDGEHPDPDSEDDLGYSLNKMSITLKSSFKHQHAGNIGIRSQMPARIRPSTSPD